MTMEMKNMKMSSQEQKQMNESMTVYKPEYPWGLCLHLNEEAIDKLGLPALPGVGEAMMLHARVMVNSVSMNESQNGKNRSLELQITDMGLGAEEKKSDAAEALYGKQGE